MSENIETSIDSSSMRDYTPEEDTDVEAETTSTDDEQTSDESSKDTPSESKDEVSSKSEDTDLDETQSSEESFAKSFDPKNLSPELQSAYKQMQADYTKKTQEIAGSKKQLEAYKRNEALIQYLSSNPQVANQFIEQMNAPKTPQESEVEIPDDPVEFYKRVKEESKKETLDEFMKYMNQREQQQSHDRWVNEQAEAAAKLDPRLDDEGFASIISDIVTNDTGIRKGEKDIVQATRDAIARYDAHFNAKLEAEKKKLSDMAKQKRNPSMPSTNAQVKAPTQQPKTIREAFEMSFGK
jgi:hypothetical protein